MAYNSVGDIKSLPRNIPYVRQQFLALLGNTSTPVKCICVVIFFSYFLSFSEAAIKAVSVTPGYMLPSSLFCLWTPFTFCFLEIHFWEVCVDIVTVGLCGKLIEPLWGQMEMLIFFAVVNLGVAVLSTSYYILLYYLTYRTSFLFGVHVHGLAGYIAGVCVAVKQIMPDHLILKTPLGKFSNRNIPLTVQLVSVLLWAIGLLDSDHPIMFGSGLFVSWIYLRFYQRHSNGTKGDMADNFTFASFFPNVLQPPMAVVGNSVYKILVKARICRRTVKQVSVAVAPTGVTVSLPGLDPHDMERRRQKALKALNERLGKVEGSKHATNLTPSIAINIPVSMSGHRTESSVLTQGNIT
ncbi:transmembrane protein, putative [Pediculus humanus corporis]|uniref:Transmembrane protein, putative n=1 Tax=Pediculus humanus subsp. corporis TaxID=121224 RepID=E0VAX0_PEDHC|nr:uncharacterized protein Phum_PHUM046560 [Pediculus humanus corporis]EEB10526.1 transmembrane protein, putative [Pediculus humanus corporis]